MCPLDGEAVTLCCGKTPFELPRGDRLVNGDNTVIIDCPTYRKGEH